MTVAMEIRDSTLRELHIAPNGDGYALFHAVIFRSDGQVFEDAQESGWQDLRFHFTGVRIEGEVVDLSFDAYARDGELWVDGKNQNGVISLPANHNGNLCLELRLNPSFQTLKIHAHSTASMLEGAFVIEAKWSAEGEIISA